MIDDKLERRIFFAIVEDNYDPRRSGRIKARVSNYFDEIPVEHIPWASPYIEPNGKDFKIPPVGKIVNIIFENGNLYTPYYVYTDKYNINLQDKLESLSKEEYKSFVTLLFDHKTQIYSDNDGLTLDYLLNKITIKKDSINLEIKDNTQKINLGSDNATERVILGDKFLVDWFTEFVKLLLTPTTLMGNLGAPILKPQLDVHLSQYLSRVGDFLSSNVYVVDNNKVKLQSRKTATSEVGHDDLDIVTQNKNEKKENK